MTIIVSCWLDNLEGISYNLINEMVKALQAALKLKAMLPLRLSVIYLHVHGFRRDAVRKIGLTESRPVEICGLR